MGWRAQGRAGRSACGPGVHAAEWSLEGVCEPAGANSTGGAWHCEQPDWHASWRAHMASWNGAGFPLYATGAGVSVLS